MRPSGVLWLYHHAFGIADLVVAILDRRRSLGLALGDVLPALETVTYGCGSRHWSITIFAGSALTT